MPQIDTYTATTKPAVPDQPFRFMETGQNPAAGLMAQGQQLGQSLSTIAGHIQAEQDSVDYGLANAKYAAAPKEIAGKVALDPEVIQNPLLYQQKFNEQLKIAQKDILDSTPNKRIHGALQNMFAQRDPEIQIQTQATQLKLATDDNLAKLGVSKNSFATLGAEAIATGNPRLAATYTHDYEKQVMDAVLNRHMTKTEGQKDIQNMQELMKEKEMFIYAKGGPASRDKLYTLSRNGYFDGIDTVKHAAILSVALAAEKAEEADVVKRAKDREHADTRAYFALAYTGELSYDVVDAIEAGKTNVDPRVGRELRNVLDGKSPKKQHDPQVDVIAQQWAMKGIQSLATIEGERAALTEHVKANGYSVDARERFDHLNTAYNNVRNANSAEYTKAINTARRYGEDALGTTTPPTFGSPRMQRYNRAVEEQIKNELRVYIETPGSDRSQQGIQKWIENRRKQLMPNAGKDSRSPAQKSSDDFANEDR